VVLGSLAGSVISNLLLVYGITQIVGPDRARLDRRSLLVQLALIGAAVAIFTIPTALGQGGPPERHAVAVASVAAAIVLLVLYLAVVGRNLHVHREKERDRDEPGEGTWSLPVSLAVLAVATGATAWVSEILVHSLGSFASAVGLSQFFVSVVIVAIVGNAAEHGGAILIARNGKMRLATEIAISSSAQVGLLVVPVVTLLSLLFTHHLALAFRWSEIVVMAGATIAAAATVWDGTSRRREGVLLVIGYGAAVVAFYLVGGR
jgi:Ca2+:H+ antiporter